MSFLKRIFGSHSDREIAKIQTTVDEILALEDEYSRLSETELRAKTAEFKTRFANGETLEDLLVEAFATVREAAWRVLDMKHYPVQLIGGIVLHQGRIAEMKTGEGKTLVATLPMYLNALAGKGVHLVTVNDYLATRDSEWMGKIYRYLGLSVGLIVHGLTRQERQDAYACDLTYGTNNEYGFDYLRDNMVTRQEQRVQRELHYAIVDEVDSILIDEARTPLIISGRGDESTDLYSQANHFVELLHPLRIKETDAKLEQEDFAGDADYIIDEKAKTAVLTARGIQRAESYFKLDNLADTDNYEIQHHINNALKAHGTMHRDEAYVVQDGEVIIVDDFTGRLMYGRRYSEGLHQAIEAKEGVKIARESKTLATITFQNYFRMYNKLSGMTGTALTEEDEFRSIYGLDVIVIPTNMPLVRNDEADAVYKSQAGKYRAVVDTVKTAQEQGQPVLVGTVSVETSELLSDLFKRNGIPHNVLNAKHHQREAEIVAQAGRPGQVTIATNMAGRGTDILLGGNPEFLARLALRKDGYDDELIEQSTAFDETDDEVILEVRDKFRHYVDEYKKETDVANQEVLNAGGLYIVGTERHESRRIDNQLRGRAGRQGDPGRSKFFISLEDDLMRLFGGERMTSLFESLGVDEDVEIQHKVLDRTIEGAQKKVEGRNFGIRKNVLEYDNVMNQQRDIIYKQRSQVLEGEDLKATYEHMIELVAASVVAEYQSDLLETPDRPQRGLATKLAFIFGNLPIVSELMAENDVRYNLDDLTSRVTEEAIERYARREAEIGDSATMREAERVILLRVVDDHWMQHIDAMDDLRDSIGMRSYGQRDPVMEYQREGMNMFDEMNASIREDALRLIFQAKISSDKPMERKEQVTEGEAQVKSAASATEQAAMTAQGVEAPTAAQAAADNPRPIKRDKMKVGRNDLCPCGSGKKYKNCHGR